MAGDIHSFVCQRTEVSAFLSFYSIFYAVSISSQVKKRLSYHCTVYALRSMLAPVLLIYGFVGFYREAFGQQPLLCVHHDCRSTSGRALTTSTIGADGLFLHLSLCSLLFSTVWPASPLDQVCCYSTHEHNS